MHVIRSVASLHETAGSVARYAHNGIRSTERPLNAAIHPVAVVDVHVDESFGACEGRKDRARYGVARPVGGMQDLDPVAPDIRG